MPEFQALAKRFRERTGQDFEERFDPMVRLRLEEEFRQVLPGFDVPNSLVRWHEGKLEICFTEKYSELVDAAWGQALIHVVAEWIEAEAESESE